MKFLFIPTSTTTLDSSNNMWIVLCGYIKILSTCKKIKALLKLLKSNVVIPSPHMIFIVSHNFKILHNYKKKSRQWWRPALMITFLIVFMFISHSCNGDDDDVYVHESNLKMKEILYVCFYTLLIHVRSARRYSCLCLKNFPYSFLIFCLFIARTNWKEGEEIMDFHIWKHVN